MIVATRIAGRTVKVRGRCVPWPLPESVPAPWVLRRKRVPGGRRVWQMGSPVGVVFMVDLDALDPQMAVSRDGVVCTDENLAGLWGRAVDGAALRAGLQLLVEALGEAFPL